MTGGQFLASVRLWPYDGATINSTHVLHAEGGARCVHEYVAAIYRISDGREPFYLVCRKCTGRYRQAVPRGAVLERFERARRPVSMPRLIVGQRRLMEGDE